MAKRKKSSRSRTLPTTPGSVARSAHGTLRSYSLGALPIVDHLLKRMKLEEFLATTFPRKTAAPSCPPPAAWSSW